MRSEPRAHPFARSFAALTEEDEQRYGDREKLRAESEEVAVALRESEESHMVEELKVRGPARTPCFLWLEPRSHSRLRADALQCMKRVLRRLCHVDADNVIELKGRIACEVSTADELLVTELIFTGALADLSPEQTVSLMSCLVVTERSADTDDAKVDTESLKAPVQRLQQLARRIGEVKHECKLPIDVEEYVASFSVALVDIVFEWCKGKRFVDIMQMTKQYEGSIIRMLHRLEELMRQLVSAAKAIGDEELAEKCSSGSAMLRRDIVFAASLYLDDSPDAGRRRGPDVHSDFVAHTSGAGT